MISHIVLFDPKTSLTIDERRSFAKSVLDVCSRLESVRRLSIGRRAVVDPGYARDVGGKPYECSAVLEFSSKDDLISYLTHPLHAQLGRLFWECCERTVICETESVDPQSDIAID